MTATSSAIGDLPDWLRGERARPTLPALVGAAGGLVLQVGAFLLLDGVEVEDQRAFGVALSALLLLVGVSLTVLERRGALHAAGVALAGGAVLPLALGVVNDPTELDSRTDVLLTMIVAVLVWLVLFVFGPARGHGLFLGLALLGLWVGAVSQTVPKSGLFWLEPLFAAEEGVSRVEVRTPETIVIPQQTIPTFTVPSFPEPTFPERSTTEPTFPPFPTFPEYREEQPQPQPLEPPSPPQQEETSLGRAVLVASTQSSDDEGPRKPPIAPSVVSILFGVVYLAAASVLDRARLPRPAGAFLAVGVPALAFGVVFVGPRHGATAVAVAAVAAALLLLAAGVGGGRRFTAWAGVAVLAGGVIGLVAEAFEDPGSGDSVAMLLIGAALVGGGWFASQPSAGAPEQHAEQADQAAHDSSS